MTTNSGMSQRWLKFLEKVGKGAKSKPLFMDEGAFLNRQGGPRMYERFDVLFHLFGPLEGSPWVPYHCPTLFASIDKLGITPHLIEVSPAYGAVRPSRAWQWLTPETMVIVDLPGVTAIEVGVILMKEAGAQLISTFDHWAFSQTNTFARPLIDARQIINTMFTLAPEVHEVRKTLTHDVAPVWICDDRRLGGVGSRPIPGTFDNRYYIDDSILAGLNTLKKQRVNRVVYFAVTTKNPPLPDLANFLMEAKKDGFIVDRVGLYEEKTWTHPVPMEELAVTKLPIHAYSRSDMGGFGKMVPVPSEGGSYSSGGGGG